MNKVIGYMSALLIGTIIPDYSHGSALKDKFSSKKEKSGNSSDQGKKEDSPVRIVADEMTCDQKTNICVATGNAFAEKINDPKKQTISAHRFVAHFKKKDTEGDSSGKKKSSLFKDMQKKSSSDGDEKKSSKTSLDKLEAFDDVVMTDVESVIRSDYAIYYTETESAELTGNVSLTQDKNQLTGTHGFANLKDNTYKITNKSGRVEGIFYQKDKE